MIKHHTQSLFLSPSLLPLPLTLECSCCKSYVVDATTCIQYFTAATTTTENRCTCSIVCLRPMCVCVCLFGCLIFSAFPTSSSSHTPDRKMANSVLCTKFNTINFLSDMYRGWWCGTHTKEEFVTRSMTTAYGHKLLPALFFLLFAKCIARQVIS